MEWNCKELWDDSRCTIIKFIYSPNGTNEAKQPLTTTQISELISKQSKGEIYKISATLRDSLELRLKREGYVQGIDKKNKGLYSITPKGQKLLQGWIVFCQLITLKFIFIISFITIYPSFHNFELHFSLMKRVL